jgi:hypothetical protein
VLSVVVLGVIGVAAWWLRRPKPALAVPPAEEARKAIEWLRGQPEDGAALSQISQILRHYVGAAFALPPGEMTTADFCLAIAEQGRLGSDLSSRLGDFLRACDQRKFAPPGNVGAGVLPAAGSGILPPGAPSDGADLKVIPTSIPPGGIPESTAGKLPAAIAQGSPPRFDAVTQALQLIELAEARRAQLPPVAETHQSSQGARAYRGASKG